MKRWQMRSSSSVVTPGCDVFADHLEHAGREAPGHAHARDFILVA